MPNLLKVRLSLKGRPIRTYTFNKRTVSIGRDPGADIFLDNTGISRSHARIERTPGGYMLEDLGSANGTFLNDRPVKRDYVGHEDVVRIGKFALWMELEQDRRDRRLLGPTPTSGTLEGTTVLTPDQLQAIQEKARKEEREISSEEQGRECGGRKKPWRVSRAGLVTATGAAFLLGLFLGIAAALLLLG